MKDNESKVFPIEDQDGDSLMRPGQQIDPSTGEEGDTGRQYSDAVMDRIAGGFSRKTGGQPDSIPAAGSGPTWTGDTRNLKNRPTSFLGVKADAFIGGREVPFTEGLGGKIRSNPDAKEIGTLDGVVTRVGEFALLNPAGDSGIAPAASANFPDAKTSTLKRGKVGIFRSVLDSPLYGFGVEQLREAVEERETLRTALVAKLSKAHYDADEEEDDEKQKAAYDADEDDKKQKGYVMTDDEDSKSAARMKAIHAARKSASGGGMLDGRPVGRAAKRSGRIL